MGTVPRPPASGDCGGGAVSYDDLANLVSFRPLERPVGHWRRRATPPFRARWTQTVDLLAKELRAHGARRTILEIDIREQDLRLDGSCPSQRHRLRSPGVNVLSFKATAVPGSPELRYEVGEFSHWQDDVRRGSRASKLSAVDQRRDETW